MKKGIFLLLSMIAMFYACDYAGDIKDYKEDLAEGGPVNTILVSPSAFTLYVDSEFPSMSYVSVPTNTVDSVVVWSSDTPEVLDVDPETGELKWGTVRNCEVVISATSATRKDVKGECRITVRNTMGVYKYLDLRAELGLFVIDRNMGATMVFDKTVTNNMAAGLKGNYYHWGNNTPVANKEFGGDDGRGGYYTYPNGQTLLGGYPEFDPSWNAEGEHFSDWSQGGETPCRGGWRLPTKEECEKIIYMTNVANFNTQQEKTAARALREKLGVAMSGYQRIPGGNWQWQHGMLWTSTWNPETKKVWVLQATNSGDWKDDPWEMKEMELKGIAIAVRCVRDGNVEDVE